LIVPTVPRGKAKSSDENGYDQYKIVTSVNFVTVPVTVKDRDNRLVDGLLRRDFSLYEDGAAQPITFFTSDPFPLSAAVLIDQAMSDTAMKKVNASLPNIAAAFSPYDEVALYTYASNVRKVSDFAQMGEQFSTALKRSKRPGRTGGVPITSGPLAGGPTVNGHPIDPGTPHVNVVQKEAHSMNDAILRAALDLSARPKARRKIIFVISDGQEEGSSATYAEVMKVLLTNEVSVYGIGVDSAAIPIYDKLSKIHVAGLGYGNILPKYVSATGGEYFAEFTRQAIEQAYAKVTEVARNQYTLGYTTRATAAANYRTIEVRVHRPSLRVYAKDGYYPLPRVGMNARPTEPVNPEKK
jgi:VWFA-related protein